MRELLTYAESEIRGAQKLVQPEEEDEEEIDDGADQLWNER